MTDKQIKETYDRIRLPAGAEQRLQEKINAELEKPMREARVVLKPKKNPWKAILAAAAVLALLLVTGGVLLRLRSGTPAQIVPAALPTAETGDEASTPTASLEPEQLYTQYYQSVLDAYYAVLSDEVDGGLCAELGISSLVRDFYGHDPLSHIGYAFADLNGDGTPELLIGCTEGEVFYAYILFDVYDLQDGEPRKLVESMNRIRWYDCGEGLLMCESSGSAAESWWKLYSLDPAQADPATGMEYVDGIYSNGVGEELDPEQAEKLELTRAFWWRWIEADGEEGRKGDPMTQEEAETWTKYCTRYIYYHFKPFRELYGETEAAPTPVPAIPWGEGDETLQDLEGKEELLRILDEISEKEAPFALSEYAEQEVEGVVKLMGQIGQYGEAYGLSYKQLRGLLYGRENLDAASAEGYASLLKKCYDAAPMDFLAAWHDAGEPTMLMHEVTGIAAPESCYNWLHEKWEIWCNTPTSDPAP